MTHYLVVGGGILGLAVAREILLGDPGCEVTVVEKESAWATHQTGRNSGVIHAGVYYPPGSLKARLSRAGSQSMVQFCRERGVPVEITGKLIIATEENQRERLTALHSRAVANGLPVRLLSAAEAHEREPYAQVVAAIHSPTTGIVNYGTVATALAADLAERGADLRLSTPVLGIAPIPGGTGHIVQTERDEIRTDVLVNCAGLMSDRVARMAGLRPKAEIVPFRGEYFELRPAAAHLVNGLIYPVPDPRFPFLGVHLTRGIDGVVHAGPNAVLALAREGYDWTTVDRRDVAEMLRSPGLRRLAATYTGVGAVEVARSLSTRRFAASVARLVPSIRREDLVRSTSGVRAQAVTADGAMVDDFMIQTAPGQVHLLNAPSPAATASLEIAKHVVAAIPNWSAGRATG